MKRYIDGWLVWVVLFTWFNAPISLCQVDSAYQHLYNVMDKYHKTFDVYTDQDAGGNNFHPTIIGNYNALKITTGCTTATYWGPQCIKISYKQVTPPNYDWAGVYWLFPDKNWGKWQGHDLSGAEKLTFWAKGDQGGEKVEFKMGGVNRPYAGDPEKPFQDSCDLISTGILSLTPNWQEFSIDLTKKDSFAVYLDSNAGSNNRYIPSGWENGNWNMKVDPNWPSAPHAGNSCFQIKWNGYSGKDGYKWNGLVWQYPEGNWGQNPGHDLTGATTLSFWARADEPGLELQFKVGYPDDSCGEVWIDEDGWVPIGTDWEKHEIELTGKDLSDVACGFAVYFNDEHDLEPDGCVFYLDDIKFDKPLQKNMGNIIGGFCCAVSKNDNPDGCTFYLDNIQYQLSTEAQEERWHQPHFLLSYEPTTAPSDTFLRNTAYIYDNALAMLAFMARGTEDDWRKAEILAKTFDYCQNHDRDFTDGRLRNGYQSGDVIDPLTGEVRLPDVWDEINSKHKEDYFSTNSHTGNLAWVMIALLRYYEQGKGKTFLDKTILENSLNSAIKMGEWILKNCQNDLVGPPGFVGGYEGSGHVLVTWKSTEHNIDAFIAFAQLAEIDSSNKDKWLQGASYAKAFLDSIWDPVKHYFEITSIRSWT